MVTIYHKNLKDIIHGTNTVHMVHRNMCIARMYVVRSCYACTYTYKYIHSISTYILALFFCMIVSKTWCYTQWHVTFYTHIFSVLSFVSTMLCVLTYITSPPCASSFYLSLQHW